MTNAEGVEERNGDGVDVEGTGSVFGWGRGGGPAQAVRNEALI